MRNKDFAALILTHGRPNKVKTYKSLQKAGYTGRIVIVVDNEDDTIEEYKKQFGKDVVVFDKLEISRRFDTGDNFDDRRAIIYARNASFEIAKDLGIKYFIQLDDDYQDFRYKFNADLEYGDFQIYDLDSVFDALVDYYKTIPAKAIAMAQGGDFIGGKKGSFATKMKLRRKCMNTFICSTDRPFQFVGRVNEDVNTYTNLGARGDLFLTIPNLAISQPTTQSNSGGMTELYLDSGTYVKSFYSVMYSPSSVKIAPMGNKNKRLHHKISWNNAVPVILNEKHKIR
jgi:hypothetical protein